MKSLLKSLTAYLQTTFQLDIKLIILGQNVRHYRVKFDVGVVKVKVHILHRWRSRRAGKACLQLRYT